MERLTVTVTEAAEILGVSRTSAYELVRAGALPSVRLGRRIVVTRRALEELLGAPLPEQRGARRSHDCGERTAARSTGKSSVTVDQTMSTSISK